jgi:hypothetical protein
MLAVFTKPIELVTAADIAELPAETWPEGYEVEFKKTLPDRKGGQHPWLTGGDIGDHARDEILSEVIAFANAQGGSVVLGIEETSGKPPRAHAVAALPRVGELARRFEDQARSCIDPPLPRLQIRAIETDGQGGGVVVFRTQTSRAAPHRLTTTRESYVRRGSSTVKMTMREIQDMTLNVARGLAGIDATFKERRDAFHAWAGSQKQLVAYRVTALPLVDLPDPGRLYNKQGLFPDHRKFTATVGGTSVTLRARIADVNESPQLRGVVRSGAHSPGSLFRWSLYQSGLTDLWISVPPAAAPTGHTKFILDHSDVLGAVAISLSFIDHYRGHTGAPDAEYGIEIEIGTFYPSVGATPIGPLVIYRGLGGIERSEIQELSVLLPRLSVGSHSEFANLLAVVDVDLYDALGIRRAPALSLPLQVNI